LPGIVCWLIVSDDKRLSGFGWTGVMDLLPHGSRRRRMFANRDILLDRYIPADRHHGLSLRKSCWQNLIYKHWPGIDPKLYYVQTVWYVVVAFVGTNRSVCPNPVRHCDERSEEAIYALIGLLAGFCNRTDHVHELMPASHPCG